jgi:hypothetical protein
MRVLYRSRSYGYIVVDMFIFVMWKICYACDRCNNSIWLLICLNFVCGIANMLLINLHIVFCTVTMFCFANYFAF